MSDISIVHDVSLVHDIASDYLSRRENSIKERRDELCQNVYNARMRTWFNKPKSIDEVRDSLIGTDEWVDIANIGRARARQMSILCDACRAAKICGIKDITLGGSLVEVISSEIIRKHTSKDKND